MTRLTADLEAYAAYCDAHPLTAAGQPIIVDDDAPDFPIPPPPAEIARQLKAERVRRSLRKHLAATPPAPELPADPDEREAELCRRNPYM